jgi:hypothetical protein
MTEFELEHLLRFVALPPLALALRERHLVGRHHDPAARGVVVDGLAAVARIRARLARHGWWN